MRFFCVIFLTAVIVLASVDTARGQSKLSNSDYPTVVRPIVNSAYTQDTRLLRTDAAKYDNDEERVITLPSGLSNVFSNIKNWFSNFISKIKLSFGEKRKLNAWLKQGKTPDEVFEILKLDKGTKGLLGSKNLRTWSVFMTMYNKKNPTKMVNMLGTLTKYYGDEAVAVLLETSRQGKTRSLANRLQTQQLTGWAQNGLNTDIVFQILRVGEGNVKTFVQNRAVNVWVYFFRQMNFYNNGWGAELTKKLLTVYDDIPMAKAFAVAKTDPSTRYIASQLQRFQFNKWLADKLTPAALLEKLKMDKTKLSFEPTVEVYVAYSAFYKAYSKAVR
ncbi:hypothetical protein P3T76_006036 [Phytophthora citrophthora]|uniref:RxLR effector protein n=1 Tax=Phytophthora citrophthora TaxID=4793 RepID=A0AAD9GPY5_9STRA|nr:hypothetical protein P3T76_006036 [Phytophthora citrophthora]